MDNETTRLINDKHVKNKQNASAQESQSEVNRSEKNQKSNIIAAAAGGFVAGAAVGAGATAAATNTPEESPSLEDVKTDETAEVKAPTPEQAILANDEGIRYAHVEADNFNDAFAQARAQVGPGGVFEYNGRLYGTYYADEWNEMSASERADYQSRVNEIAPSHNTSAANSHNMAQHAETVETIPTNAEMISVEPVDNEIRVLGVQAVQDDNGNVMNVALLEHDGDHAILVDVDNNGSMDVLLHDNNGDGYLQESEIYDISGSGVELTDLIQTEAAQQDGQIYVANDDMPDYLNDADSIMMV